MRGAAAKLGDEAETARIVLIIGIVKAASRRKRHGSELYCMLTRRAKHSSLSDSFETELPIPDQARTIPKITHKIRIENTRELLCLRD